MKIRTALVLALAISSIAYVETLPAQDAAKTVTAKSASVSRHTASDMMRLYEDTSVNCGAENSKPGDQRPAFLCSGIIIRTAVPGNTWNVWDVSPEDEKSGGVSFSYLRRDVKVGELGGVNASGFTIFPLYGAYNAPVKKHVMQVMCSFVVDGWSNFRDLNGCGETSVGVRSRECQDQGITTADEWVSSYMAAPQGSNAALWQCAWDVHTHSKYLTGQAFYESIKARTLLRQRSGGWVFRDRNELRVEKWSGVAPADLPIQSFFYVDAEGGTGAGLFYAQVSQKRYKDLTGIFIPIVRVRVPRAENEDYDFHVRPEDQAIPFPA